MSEKDVEEIKEPNLEDLEEEDLEEADAPSEEEEEKEEIETESLEARVESEKKTVEEPDDAEGSFMSVDAAEKRNVKKSDLKLDDAAADKEEGPPTRWYWAAALPLMTASSANLRGMRTLKHGTQHRYPCHRLKKPKTSRSV